jgi:hypothetical protein
MPVPKVRKPERQDAADRPDDDARDLLGADARLRRHAAGVPALRD